MTTPKWTAGRPSTTLPVGYYLLCIKSGALDVGYRRYVVLRWHGEATYPPEDWGELSQSYTVEYWRPISLELPEGWERPPGVKP